MTVRDNASDAEGAAHRLTEPYVTTRARARGLGIAIVRRFGRQWRGIDFARCSDDAEGR